MWMAPDALCEPDVSLTPAAELRPSPKELVTPGAPFTPVKCLFSLASGPLCFSG